MGVDTPTIVTAGVTLEAAAAGVRFAALVPAVEKQLDPVALAVDAHRGGSVVHLSGPWKAGGLVIGNNAEGATHPGHYFCDQGPGGPWNSDGVTVF